MSDFSDDPLLEDLIHKMEGLPPKKEVSRVLGMYGYIYIFIILYIYAYLSSCYYVSRCVLEFQCEHP